ncbi:hypothetical protein K432DRAFT_9521 [Lepidopterella palustris CBS 459.81]|uniref:Uncharacterized protein n=1 Tax=Lepidopterella palustris CBS 459.81 TaxID=1314670 RepID=A0A8E2JGH1_9PEZI|nr:hypothetical protein K432DRAFT_9521 [Lepidopterella palustris CBS 459.81]
MCNFTSRSPPCPAAQSPQPPSSRSPWAAARPAAAVGATSLVGVWLCKPTNLLISVVEEECGAEWRWELNTWGMFCFLSRQEMCGGDSVGWLLVQIEFQGSKGRSARLVPCFLCLLLRLPACLFLAPPSGQCLSEYGIIRRIPARNTKSQLI